VRAAEADNKRRRSDGQLAGQMQMQVQGSE